MCGEHPAFTENFSSWGLRWSNPRWPDICVGAANRLHRLGEPSANLPDESFGADRGHRFFRRAEAATFRVLFVVLSHERRRVVHFGVTEWTLQQMREAFPWDEAPRYVLRDRDAIYGRDFAAMT
jgi:hypothetical protein